MKRAYYTAVFAGIYGVAGLALAVSALCSGCGSGSGPSAAARRLPGDRGPSLIAAGPVAPLPPAVTYPPVVAGQPAAEEANVGR